MLCVSLDGRGVWGRMDTCIGMAESLCCALETITTSLIGYTPIYNKKLKKLNKQTKKLQTRSTEALLRLSSSKLTGWWGAVTGPLIPGTKGDALE